jgi:peptide/nickel transport system ATP-binding protein
MKSQPFLEIKNLSVHFVSRQGLLQRRLNRVRAVDQVNLNLQSQETLGVVGESGCGKTTLGRAILRLIKATSGQVLFEGEDILALSGERLRQRRKDMQIVFQSPYASFDPRLNVMDIVSEPLLTYTKIHGAELHQRVAGLLEQVGMPGDILYRYPHEFSGGQLQRIAIARALSLNPKFIVLDEPSSALDVSVQAQIINLLQQLQKDLKLTYLFITHDLSVIQHISDRVAVMYLGKVVELHSTEALFSSETLHPYTKALLSSAPMVTSTARRDRIILHGNVPNPVNPPSGCTFHPRCPVAIPLCSQIAPELKNIGGENQVACHLVT